MVTQQAWFKINAMSHLFCQNCLLLKYKLGQGICWLLVSIKLCRYSVWLCWNSHCQRLLYLHLLSNCNRQRKSLKLCWISSLYYCQLFITKSSINSTFYWDIQNVLWGKKCTFLTHKCKRRLWQRQSCHSRARSSAYRLERNQLQCRF